MRGFKQETKMYCPKCGKENPEDARFCMHCGADLSEYKVEISPKIDVSPIINISTMDKEQISLLAEDNVSKVLEKIVSLKGIEKKKTELTPDEQQAIDTFLKMDREGVVNLSKYDPQALEICAEFLDKALEVNPEIKSEEVFWNAKSTILVGLGKHTEALECLDKLLDINPLNSAGWYNKGAALEKLNRHDEANHCFDKALEINPKYELAWTEKGFTLAHQIREVGKRLLDSESAQKPSKEEIESIKPKGNEARKCFNNALEINPQFERAWIGKSIFEDDPDEKMRCIKKALYIDPRSEQAWVQKGINLQIVALEKYTDVFEGKDYVKAERQYKSKLWEAIECFDNALKIDPNYTSALKEKETLLKELRKLP